LTVAAVRAQGPYSASAAAAWKDMFDWLHRTGCIRDVGTGYGLLLDDPRAVSAAACRYDACVGLPEEFRHLVPENFSIRRLPGGAYARRRHTGGVIGLSCAISQLRHDWMPSQGLAVDTRRPVIEIYLDNPELVAPEKQRIDVCMPVTAIGTAGQTAA
jgi:AraC family transcriptional regulator